ncbi:hypothetical protein ACWE42_15580 [Sutcliffiella cohnii]
MNSNSDGLTVEYILDIMIEQLQDGIWFLLVLKEAGKPLLKETLKDEVNRIYLEKGNNTSNLVTSRYILDRYTGRLEGAGLVNVEEIGKARLYSLSEFGYKFIDYVRNKKKLEKQ